MDVVADKIAEKPYDFDKNQTNRKADWDSLRNDYDSLLLGLEEIEEGTPQRWLLHEFYLKILDFKRSFYGAIELFDASFIEDVEQRLDGIMKRYHMAKIRSESFERTMEKKASANK